MEQLPGQVYEGWFQCLALIPVVSAPKPLKVTYILWTHFGAPEKHDTHRILDYYFLAFLLSLLQGWFGNLRMLTKLI